MSGDQMITPDQARISRLEQRVRELEEQLSERDATIANGEAANRRGLQNLRRQLTPLYKALQQVFGELDELDPASVGMPAGSVATQDPVLGAPYWDTWKSRVSPSAGRVIDCLRETPHLNTTQIASAARMDHRTVSKALTALRKVGVLANVSGKYALMIPGGGQ